MPPLTDSLRLVIWVVTGIAGAIVATLSIYLEESLRFVIKQILHQDKGGRRPSKKPSFIWIIYLTAILLSVAGAAVASTFPSYRDIPSDLPQAFPPAESGETLIIVVPFAGKSENYTIYPERYVRDALQDRITLLNSAGGTFRLEIYPESLSTRREVREMGEIYKATLVLWGEFDDVGGIRAYVEILSTVPKNDSQLSGKLIPFVSLPMEGGEVIKVSRECVLEGVSGQADYLTLISLGMRDLVNGKRDEAAKFFSEAIETAASLGKCQQEPHQAYYWRGLTRSFQGNFRDAVDDLDRAVILRPEDRLAIAQRGIVYLAIGRASDAEKDFRHAISLFHPEERESLAVLYDNLGVSLAFQGDYEEAEKYLKQANQVTGQNQDALTRALNLEHFGTLYQLMGQLDSAYTYYNEALSLCKEASSAPCEAIALENIGVIFKVRGDLDTALVFVEKALKLSDDNQFVLGQAFELIQVGDICFKLGDLECAQARLERALEISEQSGLLYNQAQAYIALAMVDNKSGDRDKTLRNLQAALQILESIGSADADLVRQKIREIQ